MRKPATMLSQSHQRYLAYSYDTLALLTSILAVLFVFYAMFNSNAANKSIVVVLLMVNALCMWASYQFKNKLKFAKS